MRVLLDTHVLIWWLSGSPRLSTTAKQTIANTGSTVYFSTASAWEICTKARIGKLTNGAALCTGLQGIVAATGFSVLAIELAHGQLAGQLPGPHRDPFDRMLAAQSIIENLPLLTTDPELKALGASVLW
jgi:PIN domain nuclease of toxin-antitoxin system